MKQVKSAWEKSTEWTGPLSLDELTRLDKLIWREENSQKTKPAGAEENDLEDEHVGVDELAGTEENDLEDEPVGLDECDETEESSPEIEALRVHPQLADQYRILRAVGRGAQGTVYVARDLRTRRIVAIKALSFREIADWKASDLFMREIALLKSMRIEGTPHYIDAINATASPQPYYFLVQDFIPGESLQAKLDRGESFSTQAVIAIALAIIPILEKLRTYSPPIVHRDIKPSNIMMTPGGDIYLIDFGAAMFNERRTGGSTFAGTAGYMAPEQCMGTSTPASDVYGLGATLIHLLTGIAPYKIQMMGNVARAPEKKKSKKKKPQRNWRFLALLRKPFAALADAFQKRRKAKSQKLASSIPCALTLRFKAHLPKGTPQWLVELLEVMVAPYPNQRVKDLDRLVYAMRTIGRARFDGHSVHSDAAAHLRSMKTMSYEYIIPNGVLVLCAPLFFFMTLGITGVIGKIILAYFGLHESYLKPLMILFPAILIAFFALWIHRTKLFHQAYFESQESKNDNP